MVALVLHGYLHLHPSLIARHFWRGDKDPILSNMERRHGFQPHVAVDARTRVPAAVWLLTVVHLHQHFILSLVFKQIRRHVNGERRIAIVMLPSLLSIDIDLGLLIHTFEVEFHHLIAGCSERLPILSLAGLEPASAGARCSLAGMRSFVDIPVVRQVHVYSLPILCKLPAEVKQLPLCLCWCTHGQGQCSQCHEIFFLILHFLVKVTASSDSVSVRVSSVSVSLLMVSSPPKGRALTSSSFIVPTAPLMVSSNCFLRSGF